MQDPAIQARALVVTNPGKKQKTNEDAALLDPKFGLFVVADGPRHSRGAECSHRACELLHTFLVKNREVIDRHGRKPSSADRVIISDLIRVAFHTASQAIHREFGEVQDGGAFASVALVLLSRDYAFIAGLGDCRVYSLRDGVLNPRTSDHTFYAAMRADGKTEEEARKSPFAKNLYAAVGYQYSRVHVEVRRLFSDERLLLCTDGLSDSFSEGSFKLPFANESSSSLAGKLVAYGLEKGGSDNLTAVMVELGSGKEPGTRALTTAVDRLRSIHLFEHLDRDALERLVAVADVRNYEAGSTVLETGSFNNEMLVLVEGEMSAELESGMRLKIASGEPLGEMSLFDGSPVSATITTTKKSQALVFSRDSLFEFMRRNVEFAARLELGLLQCVIRRLRERSSSPEDRAHPEAQWIRVFSD